MKFSGDYLYRVRVIAFPEGSHEINLPAIDPIPGV